MQKNESSYANGGDKLPRTEQKPTVENKGSINKKEN